MSRRWEKPLPVELFRKFEGPEILQALGEAKRKLCLSRIPHGTSDKLLANDIINRIDDMAELVTGNRTHFHLKMHS